MTKTQRGSSPFDIPAMRALRDRLQRRVPNVGMLPVWSGNEFPTLEQLVDAAPPEGGVVGLIGDMDEKR